MQLLIGASVVLLAYFFGSIPFGLLIVKLTTGKDIRQVASGRTGGTNAMRAAGLGAGVLTAAMDVLKGASAVWVAQAISPGNYWLHILAPLATILGHNYSIFLGERDEKGRFRLRGGAGGGPTVGGAVGLWWPSFFIIVPLGHFDFLGDRLRFVDYARHRHNCNSHIFNTLCRRPIGLAKYPIWPGRDNSAGLGPTSEYQGIN